MRISITNMQSRICHPVLSRNGSKVNNKIVHITTPDYQLHDEVCPFHKHQKNAQFSKIYRSSPPPIPQPHSRLTSGETVGTWYEGSCETNVLGIFTTCLFDTNSGPKDKEDGNEPSTNHVPSSPPPTRQFSPVYNRGTFALLIL